MQLDTRTLRTICLRVASYDHAPAIALPPSASCFCQNGFAAWTPSAGRCAGGPTDLRVGVGAANRYRLLAQQRALHRQPAAGHGGRQRVDRQRRAAPGDRIAREIFRDPDYIDDPVLAEYVDGIWQPLLKAARSRGEMSDELQQRFAWQILMGRDRSVNAFALPGGYLGCIWA